MYPITKHSNTIPSHDNSLSRRGADSFSCTESLGLVLDAALDVYALVEHLALALARKILQAFHQLV